MANVCLRGRASVNWVLTTCLIRFAGSNGIAQGQKQQWKTKQLITQLKIANPR